MSLMILIFSTYFTLCRLIAEIMLFAEGFANALPLSNKMAQLYALASEQLSKQAHYGM